MNGGRFLGVSRRMWCHVLAACFAAFVVTPVTFMVLDRDDPVEIIDQRITGDLTPGGRVTMTWEARAKKVCEGTARARIISSGGIVHEYDDRPTVIWSSKNEIGTYSLEFILPHNIAPGPARREVHVRYYCNPVHRWLSWPIVANRTGLKFIIKEQ